MALPATLEIDVDRAPGEPRVRIHVDPTIAEDGEDRVRIHLLTASGLIVESDQEVEVGEPIEVVFATRSRMAAEICWTGERVFGARFSDSAALPTIWSAFDGGSASETAGVPDARAAVSFGQRLRSFRIAAGFTSTEAARRLRVSVAAISYWENGRNCPRPDRLRAMARLYGVPFSEISAIFNRVGGAVDELLDQNRREIATLLKVNPADVRIMIEKN